MSESAIIDKPIDTNYGRIGYGCRVILWNCNCHSFDEVIVALMSAIRCSPERGYQLALNVHNNGKTVVYEGHRERCEAVAEILTNSRLCVTLGQ